jgi:hypothetical protein
VIKKEFITNHPSNHEQDDFGVVLENQITKDHQDEIEYPVHDSLVAMHLKIKKSILAIKSKYSP